MEVAAEHRDREADQERDEDVRPQHAPTLGAAR
jgi:hypothetical protein